MTTVELAQQWLDAKRVEKAAVDARVAVEVELTAVLPHKPEGSQTHKVGAYDVTFIARISRKLDKDMWAIIKPSIPEALRPTKLIEQLDEPGCRWLQKNDPKTWAQIAPAVTAKPSKIGVAVVRKERKD